MADPNDLDTGDEVTACWGPEKYSPYRYQPFELGPFIAKTKVRPGETGSQAMARAYRVCLGFAKSAWDETIRSNIARVKQAQELADQ